MSHTGEPKSKYLPFGSESPPAAPPAPAAPWFGPQDLYLFNEGSHLRLYDKFGSHPITRGGVPGAKVLASRPRQASCLPKRAAWVSST